jgi:hypothetical protein
MKIYQISGLGANGKAFKNLKLNNEFEQINIPWLQPEVDETLVHYTERMLDKINPTEDFLLMGLSFGGILVQEMNRFVNPKHTILLSTIKDRLEMPKLFRFASETNAHKLVPMNFLTSDKVFSYMMLRKIYFPKKQDALDEIFEFKDHYYLRWSINQIVNWHRSSDYQIDNLTHIHGNKDIVFPISNIKNCEVVEGGTHIMVMQKPKIVSGLINQVLDQL